jgi:hypothetical protein
MTHRDFMRIKPGRMLLIFERFGREWVERRVIKRITNWALVTAPKDNLNAEAVMQVNKRTFKPLPLDNQFAIVSDLGEVIVKAALIPEPNQTKKG